MTTQEALQIVAEWAEWKSDCGQYFNSVPATVSSISLGWHGTIDGKPDCGITPDGQAAIKAKLDDINYYWNCCKDSGGITFHLWPKNCTYDSTCYIAGKIKEGIDPDEGTGLLMSTARMIQSIGK